VRRPSDRGSRPHTLPSTRWRSRFAIQPGAPRVKIHEADAKALLAAAGLPVPPWAVARTPAEAGDIFRSRGPKKGRQVGKAKRAVEEGEV